MNYAAFTAECSIANYVQCVQTIKEALFDVEIAADKIEEILKSTNNSYSSTKDSAYAVLYTMYYGMKYEGAPDEVYTNFIQNHKKALANLAIVQK